MPPPKLPVRKTVELKVLLFGWKGKTPDIFYLTVAKDRKA